MTTIIIIGFVQAVFFATLAITKKKKETADYILATLFLVLSVQIGVNYVVVTDHKYQFPHLIGTAGPLSFLYGPLLFFFIKNYISEKQPFKAKYLWHLLPFMADVIYHFSHFYLQSGQQKITELQHIVDGTPGTNMSISMIAASISPVVYCFWAVGILSSHRHSLKGLYSFTSGNLKLEWLWYLTWSMLVVGISAMAINITIVFFEVADWVELRLILLTIASLWVFFLGYYSIKKTPFYRSYHCPGMDTLEYATLQKQPEKYEKTRLKEEEIPGLKKNLLDYMVQTRPYLNQNLTIGELAELLHMPTYQLSQLINDQLGQSFYEFINTYRVEEVKLRFFDPKYSHLTLPGIAMECGFSSKASFNRIFKQMTGLTPTEYIKNEEAA
ncbi:MAG: AraC family transcriptional regulator [Cyclobacteriaceae bacterium]|nr:AraC family transcriptional regulator [Cyclobacteriaceae bacterium]